MIMNEHTYTVVQWSIKRLSSSLFSLRKWA